MNNYVLIPRIKIQCANVLSSNYAITAASPVALSLFAHNIGLKTDTTVNKVAILHHDAEMLGFSSRYYNLQQRRASGYINKSDYPSLNKGISISLQPTATAHITVSLVLCIDGYIDDERLSEFLKTSRVAGGSVIDHGAMQISSDIDDLLIPNGFWMVERSDLVDVNNPIDSIVHALGHRNKKKPDSDADIDEHGAYPSHSWLSAATLGYCLISELNKKKGVRLLTDRSVPDHAFCEPLLGLVQFISKRLYKESDLPFWQQNWIDNNFIVTVI